MKIAWFTPFSTKSAIGKYSQSITNDLIKHCEVDLWLSEETNLIPTELKIFHYQPNDDLLQKLKDYDLVIYNMGNYLDFHKDIYEVSKKIKGVVILHDFVMHHFFIGYYLVHKNDTNAFLREMEILYGENGRDIATDSVNGKRTPVWDTDEVIKYPFFEKAIEGAKGVVVHSRFHANEVIKRFLGPVEVISHPFYSYDVSINNSQISKADLGIPEDKILMITIGHVNPNKRIDRVIKILGDNKELAKKIIYLIIGSYDEHSQYFLSLQSLAEKYNLQKAVKFLGFQPDNLLYAYMSNADIFVNLRFPAMEGASWSLIEELYFGKPVIATDAGFYSELPDDCIIKISVDKEEEDLLKAFKKLVYEYKIRKNIGIKGRQFAIENFSAQKYSQKFLKFLDKVKNWEPVLELVDKVSIELALLGISQDTEVFDKIADEIYRMMRSNAIFSTALEML
ncbi:MAG: glycosyltransferase [Nitrospirota bacterium]